MEYRKPNLIIAGTVKAGTTSLFTYLANHPNIGACKIKESCYFLPIRYGGITKPLNEYLELFADCHDKKYILEATPGYFEGGRELAKEIRKNLGRNTKIVISLRSPVDRFLSFFRYKKSVLELPRNLELENYLDYCLSMPFNEKKLQKNDAYWGVDGGFYSHYLPDWLEIIGTEHVKIVFFEELAEQPEKVMIDLADWLNLDASPFKDMQYSIENRSVPYIFAGLHSYAITVNHSLEPFLRQFPKIKRIIRFMYQTVNASKNDNAINIPTETLKKIEAIYEKSNSDLLQILKNVGYLNFPNWLAKYDNS